MNNKKPLISIIMNCYNGEKYLKKSLQSIISQTYKNWELIFFDNKSNDESKKILFSFKDKRIKYFKSDFFVSLYQGRNLAIKKTKGDFIAFLDTDDWWTKDKLSQQVSLFNRNNQIKFIYSNLYIYDQKFKIKKLYSQSKLPSGMVTKNLMNKYFVGILTVLIHKSIFYKNKFNNNYNIIGDFDFFIRLSLKYSFHAIQKPLAYYRSHEDNFSKNNASEYISELKNWIKNNQKAITKKNLSFFYLIIKIKKLQLKKFFMILKKILGM